MDKLPARIRALRRRQQRTLSEIAERCGFTVSLLSMIESGKSSPPIATLSKIAKALGVSLGDLIEERKEKSTVLTQARTLGSGAPTRTDKGYGFFHLSGARTNKAMEPFLFIAEKGKVKPSLMSHYGEEFVYVLSGRMRYQVGGTSYTLGPGDSLYFDSEEEHDLQPLTDKVRYLAVFADYHHAPPKPSRR